MKIIELEIKPKHKSTSWSPGIKLLSMKTKTRSPIAGCRFLAVHPTVVFVMSKFHLLSANPTIYEFRTPEL
jgi:hypothetical protein